MYVWLRWVFFAAHRLSLVAVSRGCSSLRCVGLLIAVASRRGTRALGVRASVVVAHGLSSTGSVVVAHGLSCSVACGIFPDQGWRLFWNSVWWTCWLQGPAGRAEAWLASWAASLFPASSRSVLQNWSLMSIATHVSISDSASREPKPLAWVLGWSVCPLKWFIRAQESNQ